MMQLSALTPQQLATYKIAVKLVNGYYPSLDKIKKILIVNLGGLGDMIFSIPFLRGLQWRSAIRLCS
jgi:hypothetical protein